ncbi:hypothetical protein ORI20_03675 [Mycobacterium sp. CVI_P3]|uniref:DUF3105 domain-containing protein n=1 Tax=Mycobacterium pinniadriaticum TaxID=2994102 RepID=A0ABT3S8F6_9MYCO|nr:hypothetical protein [Mycobacterium pinniadriaticum]MCX2929359.1 hypothetical protein [Mycobacterium pinniadriaticum]MCX2935783.1 hypothetical protein [Mycobacterium pinniadriaticum]
MTEEKATTTTERRQRRPQYFLVLGLWVVGLVAALMVLTVIDHRVTNAPLYVCPPDCGRPPTGLPVANNPRFVAPDGEFSVSYPAPGAAYTVTTQPNGVSAEWTAGDGGTLRLFSRPAEGRDARQVVEQVMADDFPDSVVAYELPNATVGFQLGYGVVANFQPDMRADPLRVIVIAAVKNDLALVASADGPFREFSPEFGPGPPSAANLQIAQDMGKYVDSFSWRDDPPA